MHAEGGESAWLYYCYLSLYLLNSKGITGDLWVSEKSLLLCRFP